MRFSRLVVFSVLLAASSAALPGQTLAASPDPGQHTADSQPLRMAQIELMPSQDLKLSKSQAGQPSADCFYIRSYFFKQDAPGSDAVKMTGSTTCQAAAQAGLRNLDGAKK